MPDPRNRKYGLTEVAIGPGLTHTAPTKKGCAPPGAFEKKSIQLQLTRKEFLALDRQLAVYRKLRAGACATRQDLIRYWIAGGRLY